MPESGSSIKVGWIVASQGKPTLQFYRRVIASRLTVTVSCSEKFRFLERTFESNIESAQARITINHSFFFKFNQINSTHS